ncbi:MAG: hypothetical protein M1840_002860 [Geoglossum simile]|nr:MAG: hypothetical protein M1840_002860 [Geoglossum simile]
MASSSNARSSAYADRRSIVPKDPTTTKPRVASGRVERGPQTPRQVQPGSGTVPRRNPSVSTKPNGGGDTDRRTERVTVTTRENVSIRTRSPVKEDVEEYVSERRERDRDRDRAGGRIGPSVARREKDVSQAAWKPQAHIIPHTTAPLASRISVPPLASHAPAALQPQPLIQFSVEVQEAAILEDLLFVFMGYEGQYIRFVDSYNPTIEKNRLTGAGFRILPGLDPSLRDLTSSMLKMATHYGAVEAFVEVQSREEFGAVNHALCAAVRKLLKDYLTLIAQLEHQFLTNPSFTLHVLHLHTLPTSKMMSQLYSLAHEILRRNSLLEDDLEDSVDDFCDDNILDALREGGDLGLGSIPGKKICKGGSVLGLLTRRLASMSGDPAARALLSTLLREASRPYMLMLNEWLHHGGIKDPHGEFLVREQKSIRRERLEEDYTDEYWEKRYTIREADVPPQLEGLKDKVLLAGKYLNVVRECGGVDVSKEVSDVPRTFEDVRYSLIVIEVVVIKLICFTRFLENVNDAYAYANSSLLNLLLTTYALPARLRSLKHYFFLDRSDFFSYFLELGASELKKPVKLVNVGKLQSLLDIVLRQPGSVAAQDPFKEDVKVQMNESGLTKWLMRVVNVAGIEQDGSGGNGLDSYQTPAVPAAAAEEDKDVTGFTALQLDYSVPFPLSLVISRKTVLRYQLLFRYLLSLRHLETLLVGSWLDHSKVISWKHKSSNRKLEMWKRRAWILRARMLVFVQQLLYFCTAEVIEPNWQGLMARLNESGTANKDENEGPRQVSRTVDELMQDHVDFLDTCLKECMLTNAKLLKIHAKIMTTCTMFATYTGHLSRVIPSADPDLATDPPAASTGSATPASSTSYDPARLDKLTDNLQKYEDNFSRHLKILLDALGYYAATETVVLLGLCARLSTANEGLPGGGLGGVGSVG